jgi:ankyrin repeat protein
MKTLQRLLELKADVNATDHGGHTPLMLSCRMHSANRDRVKMFLAHGARVSLKDKQGNTALDYARGNAHKVLIPLLDAALKKEQTEPKISATTATK